MTGAPVLLVARSVAAVTIVVGAAVATTAMFAGDDDLVLLGAAAVVGAAPVTALAALRPRTSRATRAVAGLVALAAYVVLALAPGGDVADGPRRLLTGALPLDPAGPELAAVAVAVGIAAVLAADLAARWSRAPVAAAPGLAAYLLALWVGASAPPAPTAALLLVVAGSAALLAATAPRPRAAGRQATAGPRLAGAARSKTARRPATPVVLTAAAAVAVVAATVVLVSPQLPGSGLRARPADARDLVAEPVAVRRETSPLVRYPALLDGPDRLLFVVRDDEPGTSDRGPLRLRWVTLDRFDGSTWSTAAAYQRAGRSLPAGPTLDVRTDRRTVTVQVRAPDAASWLPSVGRPTTVSTSGLGVDPASGDLAVPVGADAPARYTVTGAVAQLQPEQLRAAVASPGPAGTPPYDVPASVTTAAQQAAAGAPTAFGRLAGLESLFRRSGRFSVASGEDAPAGHGLFQITRLLTERTGTAEQYASAFAVMARTLGYDARVVVGFRPAFDPAAHGWVVRARSVHAWPEVRFAGLGWVAFEPTPSRAAAEGAGPDPADAGDSAVDQAVAQEQAARAAAAPRPAPARPAGSTGSSTPWRLLAVGVGVLALLLVAGLALVPLAKLLRRRSRRVRPDSRQRVLGAWREAADRLGEHGLPTAGTLSRPEVAAAVARRDTVVGDPLRALARLADDAGFAPDAPVAGADDAAWEHADAVARALRRRALPARVRAAVDPRPLVRR